MILRPVPGLPIEQQPETVIERLLIYGEARGEDHVGRLAVLHVVNNRALKADTSIKLEALRRRQFSCFNDDDPNRAKLLQGHVDNPVAWAAIDAIAGLFDGGLTQDPTKGATHYYVLAMDNPPAWGRGHADWIETTVIGHHVFGIAG